MDSPELQVLQQSYISRLLHCEDDGQPPPPGLTLETFKDDRETKVEARCLSSQPIPPNLGHLMVLRDGSWLMVDSYRTPVVKRWVHKINQKGDVTMTGTNVWRFPEQTSRWNSAIVCKEVRGSSSFLCFFNWELIRWNYKTGEKEMTYTVEETGEIVPGEHSKCFDRIGLLLLTTLASCHCGK